MYTPVQDAQIQSVLDGMKAGQLAAVTPLTGGLANSNYRLDRTDAEPLVLKICDERGIEEARSVALQAVWMADHGIPTPKPLQGPNGDWITVIDNRAWMFQPYVAGQWIQPTPKALQSLGRALALLHQVPSPPGLCPVFNMGFPLFETIVAKVDARNMQHPYAEQLREALDSLRSQLPTDVPHGVIHGDLFPSNALEQEGTLVAILDWEEICYERFALDLAMTVVGHGWQDGKPAPERWRALRAGYESIRPLEPVELETMALFHRYAMLSIGAWRFNQFVLDHPELTPEHSYAEMAERLAIPYPFDA